MPHGRRSMFTECWAQALGWNGLIVPCFSEVRA
jgi:hypothetical protein